MNKLDTIMLVEDDDDIREIAARLLLKLGGFNVTACRNGLEALDKVLTSKPQLILLDVMMPGMDGFTTLTKLRALKEAENTPVVFMTARVQKEQVKAYLKLGVIGVISKPFDPTTLVTTVNNLWLDFQTSSNKESDIPINLSIKDKNKLSDLYQLFHKELPATIATVINKWNDLQQHNWNASEWHSFYLDIHKLCGSTGTFGFAELSEALIKIEILLHSAQSTKPTPKTCDEISAIMQTLEMIAQKKVAIPKLFLP